MTYKEIDVKIKLQGWFPDIYDHNKPEGMSDESYLNAIVSSWLIDKDDQDPIPKQNLCSCGKPFGSPMELIQHTEKFGHSTVPGEK